MNKFSMEPQYKTPTVDIIIIHHHVDFETSVRMIYYHFKLQPCFKSKEMQTHKRQEKILSLFKRKKKN